jgi:endonuclease YncB( thermonuclease family)
MSLAQFSFSGLAPTHHRGVLGVAVLIFAAGFMAGAIVRPVRSLPSASSAESAQAAASDAGASSQLAAANVATPVAQLAYPADVLRIIDGDTFEARVHVWPGLDVTTKIRLRNIDAPELHARCADELAKAQSARTALETMLAAGAVTISRVGIDKYGGRVDALVAAHDTPDVSTALLNGGFARSYDGGRRGSWCG